MTAFKRGERVRIIDQNIVYRIKDVRKTKTGGILYLLKSLEENSVFRMCHEHDVFLLERIY
ncbi:MAG TPA: hypothetical protein VIG05_00105 [Candidatus Nitrosotenuis sp.]